MDQDGIRLTSYFRDRKRADRGSLSAALAELYAKKAIAASIVLQGIDGSVTVIATGTRPSMEALLDQAAELTRPGLLTIEHTNLLTGDIDPVWLGEEPGEATRLTVHFGHRDLVYQVPAYEVVCELLYRRGIAGAIVMSGTDGTASGRRQRPRFLRHDSDAPLMVIAVDSGNKIAMVLPELAGLFRHPVMTVDKVRVWRDGQLASHLRIPPVGERAGTAAQTKLTAYLPEAARHDGQPIHRVIARELARAGIGGAGTVRGIWGFHASDPRGDHFPYPGRHVPAVTTVIGAPARISATFGVSDIVTADRCLITAETVLTAEPACGSAEHLVP